jgi:uncharacterized membrane-anchored protein YhcB (DUF1043 family)
MNSGWVSFIMGLFIGIMIGVLCMSFLVHINMEE